MTEAQKEAELTHEQIWDDSELVQSWDAALEEYKKYHSMAMKGEKVEVKPEKAQPNGTSKEHVPANFVATKSAVPEVTAGAPSQPPHQAGVEARAQSAQSTSAAPQIGAALPPGLASMPQTLLGATQDENMKNIMLSWYYAGYYTGLYEGQQKAWAAMQEGG